MAHIQRLQGGSGLCACWGDPGAVADHWRFAHKLDMRRLVTFSFIMYAVCFYWRAYTFETGDGLWRLCVAAVYSGLRGSVFFYAADHHHAVWLTA